MVGKRGQRKAILEHLKNNKSITSKEAFVLYGATRLSAIIFDLRESGYSIITRMVDGTTRYGDSMKYAEYYLVKENDDE